MKFKILTLLLSAGIVLAACGNDKDDSQQANQQDDKQQTTQSSDHKDTKDDDQQEMDDTKTNHTTGQTIAVKDIETDPKQAIETAQTDFDGKLKKVEYKNDMGEWVYKVELVNNKEEAEVKVSDKDNKVLHTDKEMDEHQNMDDTLEYKEAISYKEAVKKAQNEMNGDLKQWQLSKDDGKLIYEVELIDQNKEIEFKIDAKTGEVLEMEH
ncbi:PepSY domain-containing protein [Staphylococcus sp. 17KM0847]|uniref:PepSY domain-containing protein n=1 Tax=Staphylococcus sp. 17KM0847 TaxID=2583989 RepID=UPI0015DC7DCD|nr:PepSY domain-containing protein [Staphylococcus sp. 17KM0847]QLK85696.1 hypothetical protein FGL66_02715 [Staphylococcus sp. 17KM0847]